MAFMAIGLNSTTTAIASLRERNTFKLYVCFPVSRGVFLAALIVARMIMMALSALVLLTVARVAFGIALPIATPGLRALPIVLLGAAMVLSIGVLLASRTKSLAAAELACNVTYYPLLFFSDLTIPDARRAGTAEGGARIPAHQPVRGRAARRAGRRPVCAARAATARHDREHRAVPVCRRALFRWHDA